MLKKWIDKNCKRGEPSLPTKVERKFLTETGQSIDESSLHGTLCLLYELGYLTDRPHKHGVQTVLVLT